MKHIGRGNHLGFPGLSPTWKRDKSMQDILPGHEPFTIIDGHVDLLYEMTNFHPDTSFDQLTGLTVTPEKISAANVMVLVTALYCPDTHNGKGKSARFLEKLIDYAKTRLTGLHHILSANELTMCLHEKKPGMIWLIENADGLLELDRDLLASSGIRVAGLTHAGRNRLGDGNSVSFPGGLTGMGRQLVKELGQLGFAFDVAHLAKPGFRDLLRIHEGRLLSSHTGVRALCNSPRNLSGEQIRIILERKGIIGIAADPKMLSPDGNAGIEDVFRHIDWIAQSFEADGIGIGSDFCGFHGTNRGLEDISRLSDLAALLLTRGYPEESVRKIMGDNWRDFYSLLLPS